MAVTFLQRLAAGRPAPVFVVSGMAGAGARNALLLDPRIDVVDSPRHATILLVAGGVPADQHQALRRLHAQLPRPAATLWYRSDPLTELDHARRIDRLDDLPAEAIRLHRALIDGSTPGDPDLLPDQPPHPWQGKGMHGQGGEGMMGGVPYGRPMAMAMMQDLRDGLQLDSLSFTLGPFYPALPPGLQLKLTLQGNLLQKAMIESSAYPVHLSPLFFEALKRPVPIAALEIERARYHLHRLAHLMRLAGLSSLAQRTLLDAVRLQPGARLPDLHRRVTRSGLLHSIDAGLGQLDLQQARMLGGVAWRAAGMPSDARSEDPSYVRIGFKPLTREGSDIRARLCQLVAEITQALALAAAADQAGLQTGNTERVETPRGELTAEQRPADASHLLMGLLPGLEWSQALLLIASLDIAALSPYPMAQQEAGSC
ncbi:hypothetical protein [Stutzerimonas stutzeri]|uniref:hypothetical protein n=1 Tax=Stutzerimonas stutzeri TaxID=316 RepID=UPI00210A9E4B|nr:hypothetical protein [Stutzerimonas stutzeri]MCQ4320807.1 hypothetical protein [Stutzerimonas stutzeri]